MPGLTGKMKPVPDHGEHDYKGSGRLKDKKAIITGADGGIGRAVAIAYAREGADVLISYLQEHEDAGETRRLADVGSTHRKATVPPMPARMERARTTVSSTEGTRGDPHARSCRMSGARIMTTERQRPTA
jgi:NAD(P)-dependent dehydrogenase (short-subunit alcohol dehydrogenase family)